MKPLKIHIYKRDLTVEEIIFVGNVPDNIKKALDKNNERELKKYFGNTWKKDLFIDSSKSGGAEDEISLDEIMSLSNITKKTTQGESQDEVIKSNSLRKYIFLEIHPHDTVLEFKRKISLATGIPIYKQHIWYNYLKKKINLNYIIYINGGVVSLNFYDSIFNVSEKQEMIGDIPILIDFYNVERYTQVKAFDSMSIMADLVNNFNTREFYLISMDEYIDRSISKNDDNTNEIIYYGFVGLFWPMITYDAWKEYCKNSQNFEKIYPDLSTPDTMKLIYEKQSKFTEKAFNFVNSSASNGLKQHIYISIKSVNIAITSIYTSKVVKLRNIFDFFELDEKISSVRCSILHKGKRIIFDKTYKTSPILSLEIPLNSVILRIKDEGVQIDLYIFQEGNISLKTRWGEELLYGFDQILMATEKILNPIIDKLNKLGNNIFYSGASLQKLDKHNYKFSEVQGNMIYRKHVGYGKFNNMKEMLDNLCSIQILKKNTIGNEINELKYFFLKGMYKSDPTRIEKQLSVKNYYEYMTHNIVKSKWEQLFVHNRKLTVEYFQGSLVVSISGIRQEEFDIFYMYMLYLLNETISSELKDNGAETHSKRNVKSLKQQDPILYDYKKIYNSDEVYSRICQKTNQPVILTNDEFERLPNEDKKRAIDYWNFTTNSKTKYYCPNKKYPHIQFIIKRHPKDYCIPCCKKKKIGERDSAIRNKIFNTCLESHSFSGEKKNVIDDTRYIMNYGKFVTTGRICNLPEDTVEPLLYENFSDTASGIEPQCEEQNRFYIYGIEQSYMSVEHSSLFNILSFVMEIDHKTLIDKIIQGLKKSPNIFRVILDGRITKYFYVNNDLIQAFHDIQGNKLVKPAPWNEILIDIAFHIFNIISVVFVDQGNNNIKLHITARISNNQLISDNDTILLIRRKNIYNPIFMVNPMVYFRSRQIYKKMYNKDAVLETINNAINYNKIYQSDVAEITLEVLENFTNSIYGKKYKITKYFVTERNLCYYVEISDTNTFYFPVFLSPYSNRKDVDIVHDNFNTKDHCSKFALLNSFIKDINQWIAKISAQENRYKKFVDKKLPLEQQVEPIYPFIRLDKWILLKNPYTKKEAVIGFRCREINYYHENFIVKKALSIKKADFEQILYHPDEVNLLYYKRTSARPDNRLKNISSDLYDYHLYELLLLEFTEFFMRDRNSKLRDKIKKIIVNMNNSSTKSYDLIRQEIESYYEKYDNKSADMKDEDITKISTQINTFLIEHRDKNKLLDQIETGFYNFDNIYVNSLKSMDKKQIVAELKKVSKNIVEISTEQQIKKASSEIFPNMLVSCQGNFQNFYCKRKKLIITSKNLELLLNIMSEDILNPFKQRWIFSIIFSYNIVNFFRFIKRKDEKIYINVI
jgi:hypothetical protein